MDQAVYGTLRDVVFAGGFRTLRQRELTDRERERITRLAQRLQRRLQALIQHLNRQRTAGEAYYCEAGFEPVFVGGFRGETPDKGGFSGITEFSAIRCNFDLSGFLTAYVWRLSQIVPDLVWHYNYERYFQRGNALVYQRGALSPDPSWRLPPRLLRFVQPIRKP